MIFKSETDPAFSIESNPEHNWELNFAHALEAERTKFQRSIPRGIYRGEDGRAVRVGWKNNCFQVNIIPH